MAVSKFPKCINVSEHVFVEPTRAVFQELLMGTWKNSEAYHEYFGFIVAINETVKGKSMKENCHVSPMADAVIVVLQELDEFITQTPPIEQPQRFGNKAFRTWIELVTEKIEDLLKTALPEELHGSVVELRPYFLGSFGNSTRIDYGTGHEMSFCMFLFCLFKIGAFTANDAVAVVNKVFNSYLELVRRLQKTYRMEPAGSHGAWSLDDYQFIPFLWGSSQMNGRNTPIEPQMFLQETVYDRYESEYMFIRCVKHISTVKTGHFAEHSNQLWNISGLSSWNKINAGLLKMYKGEVLEKFPVIQHVLFGSLLRFENVSQLSSNIATSTNDDIIFKKPV